MSDYTPTADVVRERYWSFNITPATDWLRPTAERVAGAEFDRWFAEEIRKAKRDGYAEGYGAGFWVGVNQAEVDQYPSGNLLDDTCWSNPYEEGD